MPETQSIIARAERAARFFEIQVDENDEMEDSELESCALAAQALRACIEASKSENYDTEARRPTAAEYHGEDFVFEPTNGSQKFVNREIATFFQRALTVKE